MDHKKSSKFQLGRSSSPPLAATGGRMGGKQTSSQDRLVDEGAKRNTIGERFKLAGPPPGIQVQYGGMELDAYGKPLSPTNLIGFGATNNERQDGTQSNNGRGGAQGNGKKESKSLPDHIQIQAQGPPKLTGLSSYEYATSNSGSIPTSLRFFGSSFNWQRDNIDSDIANKYLQISEGKVLESLDLVKSNSCAMELSINLPVGLLVDQIELKLHSESKKADLFSKYLKLVGVTKKSVVNSEDLEQQKRISDDVEITIDGLTEEERLKQKYIKLKSGFFDKEKRQIELNFAGNFCHQVNLQFEFNKEKALALIEDCKTIVQSQINKHTDRNEKAEPTPLQNMQASNTQSQLLSSSYGNDFYYDIDGSEVDDLDNEVSNIARKYKEKRNHQEDQNSENRNSEINHSDIKLNLGEFKQQNTFQETVKIQENQSPPEVVNNEDREKLEERKLFEGTNMNMWATRLLKQVVQSIKIHGFNTHKIPAITNLAHLMNIDFSLKKEKIYLEDTLEVNILLGTLLISSKRNTQAIEVLRSKVQSVYLKQIEVNKAKLQSLSQILSNEEREHLKVQTKKLFSKCAIIELMCAESMCTRPQLNEKLLALQRMTHLCRGQMISPMSFGSQIFFADDEYTTVVKILPFLLKFSIQCLENNTRFNREIVIISALRNIEFILETQGCSLDSAMIVILKSIFKNYPDRAKQERVAKKEIEQIQKITIDKDGQNSHIRGHGVQGTGSMGELQLAGQSQFEVQNIIRYQVNQHSEREAFVQDNNLRSEPTLPQHKMSMIESLSSLSWLLRRDEPTVKKEPNSGFDKTVMCLFNTLLESYVSVLSSISSHILHQIFYEVILPVLVSEPFEEDKAKFETMEREEQVLFFEMSCEVKIFAVKIAEKIITICQGDLIMNNTLLDALVKSQTAPSYKKQMEMSSSSEQQRTQMKNLWTNIRTKVFTNYSMKGFQQLIKWLVQKMSQLAQNCTMIDGRSNMSEIAMLELSEDDQMQLSQYLEIITFISVGRRNNQEEANSLIKIKQDYCMDLYLLLNPLLFWLDFSVEREERLPLFKQVYQTIKEVLDNLPPKKVDIDILQIIIPILQRTSEYLRFNSPHQSMLKFLDIVLRDIQVGKYCQTSYPDLQLFFLEQLNSLVDYISYCLFEDIFPVFEKLLSLCQDIISEQIMRKCILALVDKYTMKNKTQKAAVQSFMKLLIDASAAREDLRHAKGGQSQLEHDIFNQDIEIDDPMARGKRAESQQTYFHIMLQTCFFENDDQPSRLVADILHGDLEAGESISHKTAKISRELQFKSPSDLHELFVDRLQFFIDSLGMLEEKHIKLFTTLLFSPAFKRTLFSLLNHGETNLRLKCHEILETVATYFVTYCGSKTLYELAIPSQKGAQNRNKDFEMMEVDFINAERLFIAQMILQCVRKTFEINKGNDSYLQFNSLILLDYLFQNVLPVPTFQNDQLKQRQNMENQILQKQRQQAQQHQAAQMQQNNSHLEDGSSGGEGTLSKNLAGGRMNAASQEQISTAIVPERQLSSTYLGELDDAIDLETLKLDENTPEFEVTDTRYTAMRLKCVFKLWPYVQDALNSPWSNIRSICYGLICSMLKIDVKDCDKYLPHITDNDERKSGDDERISREFEEQDKRLLEQNKFYQKMRQYVIPMMLNLLSSKESESKAGGLNILGSICGLSYDFSKVKIAKNMDFFKRNSEFISLPIWQLVFDLQDDWDITIKEASIVLIQLCAPREAIQYFNKVKMERDNQVFQHMFKKMQKSGGANPGHGSMSNISSARQNSYYVNSKGSLLKPDGGTSSRKRIDWQNVDFGYQNQETPNLPGVVLNEQGKIDMVSFLNDDQDLFSIEEIKEPLSFDKDGLVPKSARAGEKDQQIQKSVGDLLQGQKPFSLDLDKVQHQRGIIDADGGGQHVSLSQRSGFFSSSNQLNQHILMKQQQQNQTLLQAVEGQNKQTQSQVANLSPQLQFEFFVDLYQDEQIQEIISIFRNDFKPPKNLWIEKQAEGAFFNCPDYYTEIFSGAIEQFNQQQMMLQLKQNQELQDQVSSNGSQLEGDGDKEGAGEESAEQLNHQYSPTEGSSQQRSGEPDSEQKQEDHPQDKDGAKTAEDVQQQIFENLNQKQEELEDQEQDRDQQKDVFENQRRSSPTNNLKIEDQADVFLQETQNPPVSPVKEPAAPGRSERPLRAPADIEILEQIDFDAININSEDINQNNQKQDVINSSDSDEEDRVHVHREVLDHESQDFIDTSEEYSSPGKSADKFKDLAKIGTDLHVIESMSNEVSASAESQQKGSEGSQVKQNLVSPVENDQQDHLLEELQKKNNQTLKLIHNEKSKQGPGQRHEVQVLDMEKQLTSDGLKLQMVNSSGQTANNSQDLQPVEILKKSQQRGRQYKTHTFQNQQTSNAAEFKISDAELFSQEFQIKKGKEDHHVIRSEAYMEKIARPHQPTKSDGKSTTQKSSTAHVSGKAVASQSSGVSKVSKERHLSKSHKQSQKMVGNSNSLPDFQMIAQQASQKSGNKISQESQDNQTAKLAKKIKKSKVPQISDRYHNDVESARLNFVSANIPLPAQGNLGNFTQRVQPSSKGRDAQMMNANSSQPLQGIITSGMQNMKSPGHQGAHQLSQNTQDYYIVQNMSSQILGPQPSSSKGSMSIKSKKTNEKSLKNVEKAGNGDMQQKGNTQMAKASAPLHENFSSDESSLALMQAKLLHQKKGHYKQARSKSVGKKKTLSISPKSKAGNEISSMLSVGSKVSKGGHHSLNSNSAQSGGNQRAKQNAQRMQQHIADTMNQQQLKQFLVSAQSVNTKKMNDNMKDLNYFIKTIEKFSKSSNIHHEDQKRMHKTTKNPLTINSQNAAALHSLSSGGATVSAPHTPKDMITSILLNMNERVKTQQLSSKDQSKKYKSAQHGHKQNKSTLGGGSQTQNRQLFDKMKNQQFFGVGNQAAEQIQQELIKNGFNLEQLNKILHKVINNNAKSKSESGLRHRGGHGSSSSAGKREGRRYQKAHSKNIGSGRSGVRGSDQSPGSINSSKNRQLVNLNLRRSGNKLAGHKYGSYSPENRGNSSKSNQKVRSQKSPGQIEGSSANSKSPGSSNYNGSLHKAKSKSKHQSFNQANPPPQLNNLMNLNYSQTQKLDLKDINAQFLAQHGQNFKQSGSTQNKNLQNIMLNQNSSKNSHINMQKYQSEWIREKSAKSVGSSKSGGNAQAHPSYQHGQDRQAQQQFVFKQQNAPVPPQYNNLLANGKKYQKGGEQPKNQKIAGERGSSYNPLSLQNQHSARMPSKGTARSNNLVPGSPRNVGELRSQRGASGHRAHKTQRLPVSARQGYHGVPLGKNSKALLAHAQFESMAVTSKTPSKAGQSSLMANSSKESHILTRGSAHTSNHH